MMINKVFWLSIRNYFSAVSLLSDHPVIRSLRCCNKCIDLQQFYGCHHAVRQSHLESHVNKNVKTYILVQLNNGTPVILNRVGPHMHNDAPLMAAPKSDSTNMHTPVFPS